MSDCELLTAAGFAEIYKMRTVPEIYKTTTVTETTDEMLSAYRIADIGGMVHE